jgi:hypothetical protein
VKIGLFNFFFQVSVPGTSPVQVSEVLKASPESEQVTSGQLLPPIPTMTTTTTLHAHDSNTSPLTQLVVLDSLEDVTADQFQRADGGTGNALNDKFSAAASAADKFQRASSRKVVKTKITKPVEEARPKSTGSAETVRGGGTSSSVGCNDGGATKSGVSLSKRFYKVDHEHKTGQAQLHIISSTALGTSVASTSRCCLQFDFDYKV